MQVVTFLNVPFTHKGEKNKKRKKKSPAVCGLLQTILETTFPWYTFLDGMFAGWNRGPAMLSIFHLLLPDVWAQSSQKQNNKESKHQEAMEETQIKPGSNFIDIFSLQLGKWDCQKQTAPQLSWVSVCEGGRKRGSWLKIAKLLA